MTVSVSVVIPVHDAAETIARQLGALERQSGAPDFEVIVVLNRCTDESAAIAQSFASRLRLRVVHADDLPSAGHARNVGAGISVAQFLLFCDADDEVDAWWVAEMVAGLQTCDLVGGRIVVDRQELPSWIYQWRYSWMDGRCLIRAPGGLLYAFGASMGCTRGAFEEVGGFDESFVGAGGEEVDFAARVLRSGMRIGEAPAAVTRYRPRTSVRGVLRQIQGYQRGEVRLSAREGRLPSKRPSRIDVANRTARRAAFLVLRKRQRDVRLIFGRTAERYYRTVEQRRWWALATEAERQFEPQCDAEDFVAPTSTPSVGGLAFSARTAQARWYGSRGVEQQSLALVELLFPSGGVFVDCGANVGVFTIAAALGGGESCSVIAFEPDQRTRPLLEQNLQRHRLEAQVQIREEAVGDSNESRTFYQYENDVVSGFGKAPEVGFPGRATQTVVDVVALSDAVATPIDMIKIDVEGFEPEVLRGAAELLERSPEAVALVELNPQSLHDAGHSVDELMNHFPSEHWVLWIVDDDATSTSHGIRRWDATETELIKGADPLWYGNLLAVPQARAKSVSSLLHEHGLLVQ